MMLSTEPVRLNPEFIPAIDLVNRSRCATPADTAPIPQQRVWLFSRRADFWLASAGSALGLLAAVLVIFRHGDRELDALDFVLSELHLGATYDAIIRRRLWRGRRVDVLIVPFVILALTYALSIGGQTILLTSITLYAAVWHRGRQSLGVARFYQRDAGGALSRVHTYLFRGAIYLPMLAALVAYTHLAPEQYEGQPYLALSEGKEFTSMIGVVALLWVITYLGWTLWQTRAAGGTARIHPGEWWVTMAHAVAFGSGYVLGASNASFLLVLAVHHEVQYLYFTYAMARRSAALAPKKIVAERFRGRFASAASCNAPWSEAKFAASFLRWPVMGFVGAVVGSWLELGWLAPLGVGGLFCHYWLDGRIWTRKSFSH
jgi:hypothetical protein